MKFLLIVAATMGGDYEVKHAFDRVLACNNAALEAINTYPEAACVRAGGKPEARRSGDIKYVYGHGVRVLPDIRIEVVK